MTTSLPLVHASLEALSVDRISPSFVRVVLGSPELAEYGIEGPRYDQRIKLVFPGDHMRTYTIRDVLGTGRETRFVVDIVVHEDGLAGPGGGWALSAVPGDRVDVLAPRRGVPYGGIEFAPSRTDDLLLVGDETALPAIASILTDLADLDAPSCGRVFVEVPDAADIVDLAVPPGVEVCWLPRGDADPGTRLVPAIREHFGLGAGATAARWATDAEIDPDLWETPTWSSSGDPTGTVGDGSRVHPELVNLYAWIAGESRMVTTLRRALVDELGVERSQVAFMGYWRKGVAIKS
ncbi:MAG: siderophore-interacting protein [Propionibacteriales bacterium]|nr:siderophore-interacting protein [Propionibacteriales bacterium]